MPFVFHDRVFATELLRTIGYTADDGADIDECLATAARIADGDVEGWYAEWRKTADRARRAADEGLAGGHTVSARESYLRAANYYRTAGVFLHIDPGDPRIEMLWGNSQACLGAATKLLPSPGEAIEIPYARIALPGYFYRVDDRGMARPTLIIHGGPGSTLEELYFCGVTGALRRGYNCLTFDGPGQGGLIRRQRLSLRPDWEHVITPVVDYALTRPEIDHRRLILMGTNAGGYLAARAAAFEHRLAACILLNGLFDVYESIMAGMSRLLCSAIARVNNPVAALTIRAMLCFDLTSRRKITHAMWAWGAASLQTWLRQIADYTLQGVVDTITCPTLVLDSEQEHYRSGQAWKLYKALTCPKTYMCFTAEECAGERGGVGASPLCHQRMFDWLDETLTYSVWQSPSLLLASAREIRGSDRLTDAKGSDRTLHETLKT